MTTIGTLASHFNRTYIYLNPDPLKGPSTWRLSNIPGINDGGVDDDIENLYTLAPITHTQLGDAVELNFDISAIAKDVNQARQTFTATTAVYNAFNYAPFKSSNQLFDLERITAVKPVMSMTQNKDVSIWFDITSLEPLEIARSKRRMKTTFRLSYNSRSVNALTAVEPLQAETVLGQATVSFDIKSLPEA